MTFIGRFWVTAEAYWLKWLAKWLVSFRMRRRDVLSEITRQCQLYCEDGVKYSTGTGKKRLRAIAYDRNLKPSNPMQWMKKTTRGLVIPDSRKVVTPLQRRRLAVSSMPKTISPTDAQNLLGLVDRKNIARDLKAGGYEYNGSLHLWVRVGTQYNNVLIEYLSAAYRTLIWRNRGHGTGGGDG